jgi:hypothetical protein
LLLFYKKAGLPLLTYCAFPEGSGIMTKLSFYGQNHPKNCVDLFPASAGLQRTRSVPGVAPGAASP